MKKKRKSRFQQRLEEMQLKHNVETEDSGPGKVRRHKPGEAPGAMNPQSQTAQTWIPIEKEKPPYYTSVDIYDGVVIMMDWARVSHGGEVDSKDDFYVNNRNSDVVYDITHWAKRPGSKNQRYDPMTKEDIPILSTNDVNELLESLKVMIEMRTRLSIPHIEYCAAIEDCITIIETTLKQKTRTTILSRNTILPAGK